MIEVRVRMLISPWTDASFVRAVEDAWKLVGLCEDVGTSSITGVALAKPILRDLAIRRHW